MDVEILTGRVFLLVSVLKRSSKQAQIQSEINLLLGVSQRCSNLYPNKNTCQIRISESFFVWRSYRLFEIFSIFSRKVCDGRRKICEIIHKIVRKSQKRNGEIFHNRSFWNRSMNPILQSKTKSKYLVRPSAASDSMMRLNAANLVHKDRLIKKRLRNDFKTISITST